MAYNNRNYLLRVLEVQTLYQQHKTPYSTHVGVYREVIQPKYMISLRTLSNYLEVPAKAKLKELDRQNSI